MVLFSTTGLSKTFHEQPLFTDVAFGMEEGERVGIIGRNGVGKTTLLATVLGRRLERLESDEGPALGAAVTALPGSPVRRWIMDGWRSNSGTTETGTHQAEGEGDPSGLGAHTLFTNIGGGTHTFAANGSFGFNQYFDTTPSNGYNIATSFELGYDGPSGFHDDTTLFLTARSFDFGRVFDMIDEKDIGQPELSDFILKTVTEVDEEEIRASGGQAVANYDNVASIEGGENIVKTALDTYGCADMFLMKMVRTEAPR